MSGRQEAMRILLDMGSSPLGAESGSGACDGLDRASDRAKLEARPRLSPEWDQLPSCQFIMPFSLIFHSFRFKAVLTSVVCYLLGQ
jgi:hypothetical protein